MIINEKFLILKVSYFFLFFFLPSVHDSNSQCERLLHLCRAMKLILPPLRFCGSYFKSNEVVGAWLNRLIVCRWQLPYFCLLILLNSTIVEGVNICVINVTIFGIALRIREYLAPVFLNLLSFEKLLIYCFKCFFCLQVLKVF